MWDLSGKKLYTFEGHDAQVYSICPHQKENIQVEKQASLVYKDPKLSFSCNLYSSLLYYAVYILNCS